MGLKELESHRLSRLGGAVVVLLLIALLVITPWLSEQWAIHRLQIRLQIAGTHFAQQLELHLDGLERQAWLRASELRDPEKNFQKNSEEWLKVSDEVVALRLIGAEGQTRHSATRMDMPSMALQLLPSQSLALVHTQELNTQSYSALYELAGKKVVDLYVPLSHQTGMTLVTTLDTSAWTFLADQNLEVPEISVAVTPYRTDTFEESRFLRVNHPSWEGHWSIELKSHEFTADILKILRPVFGLVAMFLSVLLVLHFRNHKLRLRAEENAIEKSRLLEKQSRLSMLGEMSASLAHEINQPLAIISNYAVAGQMQLQREPDVALLQKLLQKIQEQSQRAAQVLVSVRGLLHQGPVQSVCTNIEQLIQHLLPHLRQQANPLGIEINFQAQKNLFATIDPLLFDQVLLNLVRNGLQSVEKSNSTQKEISITASTRDQTIEIEVKDTGSGIAPEIERHIFDPFFTTKKDGLGIGLNLCRSVIERFQGRLVLRSNSAEGVCFVIELPIATGP
jgi:signal transduction histidine kinase